MSDKQRVRRVSSNIKFENGYTGNIILDVKGLEDKIDFEVNFEEMPVDLIHQAALAGFNARLAIAYAGLTDPQEISTAIQAEIGNFRAGKFISRNLAPKKLNVPDIVIAWMLAVGKDTTSEEEVTKYATSWANRDEEQKGVISNNLKVITELDKLQAAKRLAKKQKDALVDDSVLEI